MPHRPDRDPDQQVCGLVVTTLRQRLYRCYSTPVAGLSLGGAIAQAAAVAAPERFGSLTLMATPDRPVPEAFEQHARIAEGVRYVRDCVASFDPGTWPRSGAVTAASTSTSGFATSLRPRWRSPGARRVDPVDGMAAIAARIGGGAPHIQPLECPEAVADALGGFLPAEIDIP